MDKSIYTFTLGGKDITLKFTWGGIKKLKGILNTDPLTAFSQLKETTDTVDFAIAVIAATSELNKEEIDILIDSISPGEVVQIATGVMKAFNQAFSIDEVGGEADKDTQQAAA